MAIKTNVKATGISLTPAISDYIDKRINTLQKFFNEEALANVEVGKTTRHHRAGDVFRAEVHILSGKEEYYAAAEKDDLYAAIDEMKDEVVHELTSKRKKGRSLLKRGGAQIKNLMKGISEAGSRGLRKFRRK
jgi:ribosomal subunit interface protein